MKVTQTEQKKQTKKFLNEDSLKDLWDYKHTNICMIGDEESWERKGKKHLQKLIPENFPNLVKDTQAQENPKQDEPKQVYT